MRVLSRAEQEKLCQYLYSNLDSCNIGILVCLFTGLRVGEILSLIHISSLSERAADVHAGIVDPSVDNMLKITSDGRKLGLDQRLMNPLLPDDPDSKLNACVGNILRIWQDGQADKLTQLVFCDLSTPKNDGTFNVYDDVKTCLLYTSRCV